MPMCRQRAAMHGGLGLVNSEASVNSVSAIQRRPILRRLGVRSSARRKFRRRSAVPWLLTQQDVADITHQLIGVIPQSDIVWQAGSAVSRK
jgi:hypothetical protein